MEFTAARKYQERWSGIHPRLVCHVQALLSFECVWMRDTKHVLPQGSDLKAHTCCGLVAVKHEADSIVRGGCLRLDLEMATLDFC